MILKRLLSITPNNNKILKPRPLYRFSKEKQGAQQSSPIQEVLAETEALLQTQQMSQGEGLQKSGKFNKFKRNKRSFPRKNSRDAQEDFKEPIMIVREFLRYKRPSLNYKMLNSLLKQCQGTGKLKERLRQLFNNLETQKQKPLLDYEAKLNLTPELLIKNSFLKSDQSNNQFLQFYQGQDLQVVDNVIQVLLQSLSKFDLTDVKKMYKKKFYRKNLSYTYLDELLKGVNENPKRNFLLNTLYEQLSHSNFEIQELTISDIELNQAINFVTSGQYNQVNPLKFYWCAFTMSPALRSDNSVFALKQLNKIKINNKRVEKQLKSLSYFFLTQNVSQKIVSKIFGEAPNLKQAINLWVLTMIVISKIKYIFQATQAPTKINFNDLFNEVKQNQIYNNYFMQQLPKILYHDAPLHIFEIYRKALKNFSQNSKDLQNITIGQLQQKHDISFLTKTKTKIEYIFEKDVHTLGFNLFNAVVKKEDYWNFRQYKLAKGIINGQYSKALDFYNENIRQQMQFDEIVNKYMAEAKTQGIQDPDTRALYVLKEVFKESQKFINNEQHRLTDEKLQRAITEQKDDQQFDEIEQQYGQNSGGSFNRRNRQLQEGLQTQKNDNNKYLKRQKQSKGMFSKKNASTFCSTKQKYEDEKPTKEESDAQYQNYLRTVKETKQNIQSQQIKQQSSTYSIFNFDNCKNIQQVETQFKRKLPQINQSNLQNILMSHQQVPIIGNIKVLLKYSFLNMILNEQIPKGLQADFPSSFGDVSKNYGEYLKGCIFMFPLPDSFYNDLLADQSRNIQRHKFKKIVAHLLLFKMEIQDQIVNKICNICVKQKIGLTLLQIINLINIKGIKVSYNSLKKIAASIQNFKNMESDLLQFLKKYCERTNLQIQTKLFEPYISNLVFTQNYQSLNTFIDVLRQQLKPKQYVVDSKLSAEQNIANQKIYKQRQFERVNNQLLEMVRIVSNSLKPRTIIPAFVPQIYELYLSKKTTPMNSNEYGIGLIIQSQNQEKFLQLLKKIKSDANQNNEFVLESAIRSLMLFGKKLKGQVEKIMGATLFAKQFDLTEAQLKNFGFIFKQLDIPGAYSEFLQYILKKQPKYTSEIKSLYYKIFNLTTDDYSKNQLSGLLDYIFNPNRQKDRAQYKKVKEQEERKQKILKSLTQSNNSNEQKVQQKKDQKIEAKVAKQKKKSKKQQKKIKAEEESLNQTTDANKQKKQQKQGKQKKDKSKDNKEDKTVKQVKTVKSIDSISMTKMASTISYDQNRKMVYNSKLWSKDLRNKAVRMFVENFMTKYELATQQQVQGKQAKGKKAKNSKQNSDKKQTNNKKEPTKKQAAKKK